jgi:hypothetical protein
MAQSKCRAAADDVYTLAILLSQHCWERGDYLDSVGSNEFCGHLKALRLVCSGFKHAIDHFAVTRARLDSNVDLVRFKRLREIVVPSGLGRRLEDRLTAQLTSVTKLTLVHKVPASSVLATLLKMLPAIDTLSLLGASNWLHGSTSSLSNFTQLTRLEVLTQKSLHPTMESLFSTWSLSERFATLPPSSKSSIKTLAVDDVRLDLRPFLHALPNLDTLLLLDSTSSAWKLESSVTSTSAMSTSVTSTSAMSTSVTTVACQRPNPLHRSECLKKLATAFPRLDTLYLLWPASTLDVHVDFEDLFSPKHSIWDADIPVVGTRLSRVLMHFDVDVSIISSSDLISSSISSSKLIDNRLRCLSTLLGLATTRALVSVDICDLEHSPDSLNALASRMALVTSALQVSNVTLHTPDTQTLADLDLLLAPFEIKTVLEFRATWTTEDDAIACLRRIMSSKAAQHAIVMLKMPERAKINNKFKSRVKAICPPGSDAFVNTFGGVNIIVSRL